MRNSRRIIITAHRTNGNAWLEREKEREIEQQKDDSNQKARGTRVKLGIGMMEPVKRKKEITYAQKEKKGKLPKR